MLKNKSLLIIISTLYSVATFSQTLTYDVILLGKVIGQATISKKAGATSTLYSLTSHTDAKILSMEKKDAMSTSALFSKGGQMISSSYDDIKNDEHHFTKATTQASKIAINKDGTKSSVAGSAHISSLSLYFFEPKDHQKFFAERMGQFYEIVKEGDHKYKAAFDGYTAVYTYQSGKLVELQMKEALGEVVMKLKQ
jgi:hypothetical protein